MQADELLTNVENDELSFLDSKSTLIQGDIIEPIRNKRFKFIFINFILKT